MLFFQGETQFMCRASLVWNFSYVHRKPVTMSIVSGSVVIFYQLERKQHNLPLTGTSDNGICISDTTG